MTFVPYPYQIEVQKEIEKFEGRALLALDPGLGKTPVSLQYLANHPEIKHAVVICPSSLKYNWRREAKIHFDISSQILEGRDPYKINHNKRLIILNYDILTQHKKKGKKNKKDSWVDALLDMCLELAIFDESQALINDRSNRTIACRMLCQEISHILALSGTPIVSKPVELFPIVNMLRPDVEMFSTFGKYTKRYCAPKRTHWGWDFSGSSNLPELNQLLNKEVMIRREKTKVLHDLPAKRRIIVPLEIDNYKEYKEAEDDFIKWLKQYDPVKAKRSAKAVALTRIGGLKRLAGKLKLRQAIDWVDTYIQGTHKKILLFAVHRSIIKELAEHYKGKCVVVDGSVKGKHRDDAFEKFKKDKKTTVFIGNIDAAGTGWSAKGASATAFIELAWTPARHIQAEDRTWGLNRGIEGQETEAYYLVAEDTIEIKLCEVLQKKQKTIAAVLDGTEVTQLDVFDQLMKSLSAA